MEENDKMRLPAGMYEVGLIPPFAPFSLENETAITNVVTLYGVAKRNNCNADAT